MLCAIWYHWHNLKNVKNINGGVLLFQPATLQKVTILQGCFSNFLNCKDGIKSHKASHNSNLSNRLLCFPGHLLT